MRINKHIIYEMILFHIFLFFYALSFPKKDEWLICIFLLILVASLMFLEFRRTKVAVSPLFFWYAFWLGVISIGRMNLGIGVYPFYQTWEEKLCRIVLANTTAFFWFYILGELSASKIRAANIRYAATTEYSEKLSIITLIMLAVALSAFLVNAISMGNIPQLTGDANSYREAFIQTRYYRIVSMLRISFAICPLAVSSTRSAGKRQAILFLTILLMLAEAFSGWRSFSMQAVIMLVTGFSFTLDLSKKTSRKKLLVLLVLAGFFAVAFIGYIAVTRDAVRGAFKEKADYLLYTLYMYMAPNFLNFQTAVKTVTPLGKPLYATIAFWHFFPGADVIRSSLPEIDQNIGAFNVSTYLLQPYADLGLTGTLLCTGLIAAASGIAFSSCTRKKSVSSVAALALVNIVIFLMHNNLFLRSTSVFIWLILAICINLLTRKEKEDCGKKILSERYII